MKKYLKFLVLSVLAVPACTDALEPEEMPESGNVVETITVNLPQPGSLLTKSEFTINASGVRIVWAPGDTLGILPNQGDQVSFPLTSGLGTSSAKYDGGAWGLKNDNSYSAYYPFNWKNHSASHDAVRISYEGQIQDGNDNPSHLGAFDYLASGPASPENNRLSLDLVRIGSIVCFRLNVPQPDTYTQAVLTSDVDFVLDAGLDVTVTPPVANPVRTSSRINLGLKNFITSNPDETINLYMMLMPVDLTGASSLRIALYGEEHTYYADLTGKKLEAGNPYMFSASSVSEAIAFSDPQVKLVCISNWDSDGNGELDYEEAAAVSSLGTVFQGNTRIRSFDELQFFTGLTELTNNAFSGCSALERITLPAGLTALGEYAFNNCRNLTTLIIPEGVSVLADGLFAGCSKLNHLVLPDGIQTYGQSVFESCAALSGRITLAEGTLIVPEKAFKGCAALEEIVLPASLQRIEDNAFDGCRNLQALSLPSGLEYVGSHAFQGCSSLVTLSLPNALEAGPYGLFMGCSSLQEINIPSSWTQIGDDFFHGCSSLQSVLIPEGVIRVGDRAFLDCIALTSVSLPSSLLAVDEESFMNCSSLESITIPAGVTSLPQGVFSGCSSLSEVILPEGLVSIGLHTGDNGTFANCTSLKSIDLPASLRVIGKYAFFQSGLENPVIPGGVEIIAVGAFERAESLFDITLPSNLSEIERGILYLTALKSLTVPSSVKIIRPKLPESLEMITLLSSTPPILYDGTVIPDNGCPIYVPASAVDTYKSGAVWSSYADRIQANSDGDAQNPQPGNWH